MKFTTKEMEILSYEVSNWIRDNTELEMKDEYVIIDTPFVGPHRDLIRVYLKKESENIWKLSDMGTTAQELRLMECDGKGEISIKFEKSEFAEALFKIVNIIIESFYQK